LTLVDVAQVQGFLSGALPSASGGGTTAQTYGGLELAPVATSTADYVLATLVTVAPATIRMVFAYAAAAGAGATTIDLLKNGVSVYHDPLHRPALGAGATGAFTSYPPDNRSVRRGDLLVLKVVGTAGHSGVVATAALEEP
jgi:hypothetical protein